MATKAELRTDILGLLNQGFPQYTYLQSLFDLEDADEAKALEAGQRHTALEYASKLSHEHGEVITAANAYLAFLKGDSETKPTS